jgi:four helix bundle protein
LPGEIAGGIHAKLSIVVEEADESAFWMEILTEAEVVKPGELTNLMDEANQILKIVSASRKTVSENKK